MSLLSATWIDVAHALDEFGNFFARPFETYSLRGGRLFCKANARTPFPARPDRARRKSAAAVWANIEQPFFNTLGAERAFVSTDPSVGRIGWEILVAPFTIWP